MLYNIADMQNIPEKLKYYRGSKNWSQEQLARFVGVSLYTIQRWESGKSAPSPLALGRLKEILEDVLEQDQLSLL